MKKQTATTTKKTKKLAVDLIIFDLDMTLVDSLASIFNCLEAAFRANDIPPPDRKGTKQLIGIPLERMVELLLLKQGINATAELNATIVRAYRERYMATAKQETSLFPGVRDVLERFKEKRLAIVTTKHSNLTRKLLDDLDLLQYFNILVGYNDVRNPKPDPESIFKVLEETKVSPAKAVIIGDTIYDIEAGKSAGIHTVAVTYGVDTREELKRVKPEFIIDNIHKLVKILC